MGFHKFEKIIKYREFNYRRYCSLKDAVEHKNNSSKGLVIYFGAGSSLYSKRWGDPFEKIHEDLAKKIVNAIKNNQDDIASNKKAIEDVPPITNDKISQKLKKLQEEFQKLNELQKKFQEIKDAIDNISNTLKEEKPDYLEIGNELDKNIEQFAKTPIAIQYGVENYSSFNHACCRILDDESNKKTVLDYNFEGYVTEHLFYVAYLLNELRIGLITVNVDTCFSDICEKLGHPTPTIYVPQASKIRTYFPYNENAIVHIHGCIKNNRNLTPNFLVMTRSDYQRTYPIINAVMECVTNTQSMLVDISENYDVLFLGTSLSVDTPIALLENLDTVSTARQAKKLQYIPFIRNGSTPEGGFIEHTTPMVFEDFDDYAVVLHMILRETAQNLFEGCRWNQNTKELYENNQNSIEDLIDNQKQEIKTFLESTKPFDYIDSQKTQIIGKNTYKSILKYLYENFLVSDKEEKNWSICCILDNNFSLNNGNASPLNNMPLGDTIYIIGDPNFLPSQNLSRAKAENISRAIAEWRNYVYNYDLKKPMGNDLKIRVIIFPCKSFQEVNKEKDATIEEKDAIINILERSTKKIKDLTTQLDNGEISLDDFKNGMNKVMEEMNNANAKKLFAEAQKDISAKDMSKTKTLTKTFGEEEKIS